MNAVPCKDCSDRTVTCHSECPEYQQYTGEREEVYKERHERINLLYSINDIKEKSIKRNTGCSSPYLKSRRK